MSPRRWVWYGRLIMPEIDIMTPRPEIEVFYDGDCPVCCWEVRLYGRMDKRGAVRWTDIGALGAGDLPPGKTQADLLGRFHVRDVAAPDDQTAPAALWFIGVDAFARIWRVLPGLHYFAGLFRLPGVRQLTMVAYRLFLKWQRWHRQGRAP